MLRSGRWAGGTKVRREFLPKEFYFLLQSPSPIYPKEEMCFAFCPWTRMGLIWLRLGSGSLIISSQRMLWLWFHRKFKDSQNFRTGSEFKHHPMHSSAPSYASIHSAKSFIYSTNISWAPTVRQVLRTDSEPNRQIPLPSWNPHSIAKWFSYLRLHKWMRSGARTALPGTGLISTRFFPPLKQHTPFCLLLIPGTCIEHLHRSRAFSLQLLHTHHFIFLITTLQGKYDAFPSSRWSGAIVRLCDWARATQLAMEELKLETGPPSWDQTHWSKAAQDILAGTCLDKEES